MSSIKRRNFVVKHSIETVSHKGGKHVNKKRKHELKGRFAKHKQKLRNIRL